MKLIQVQVEEVLDRNALVLAGFAFLGSLMSTTIQAPPRDPIALLMKIEGLLFLFIVLATELAKSSIIRDKQSKRIEFILANGVSKKALIKQYVLVLYLASLLVLSPALALYIFSALAQGNPALLLGGGFGLFVLAPLASTWLVYYILYSVDMNRLNGIQMKALAVLFFLMTASFVTYHYLPMVKWYLGIKAILLCLAIGILSHKTRIEGIVRSYY